MRAKWHATRHEWAGTPDRPNWTIGPLKDEENWNTDSGCPGYGMTKEDAERAVACYNACLDMDDPETEVQALKAARVAP